MNPNATRRNTLWLKIAFGCTMVPLLVLAGNYLAGMLCLVFFSQDPRGVAPDTFWYAWEHTAPGGKASQKVLMAAGISGFICLLLPFLLAVTGRKSNPNVHGKARFATDKEIEKNGFFGKNGMVVGKLKSQLLRFPGNEFVLLSAPTRSGKGVSTVIPSLLSFEGSVVVLDIKGENYQITSHYRASQLGNRVIYFNPFVETSHRWNPLSYVSADPHARGRDLMALAVILFPDDPKNPFFSHSSRNMFLALGLMVLETPELPPTMGEILRQASGKGRALKDHLALRLAEGPMGPAKVSNYSLPCQEALNRLLQNSEETLKNIQASFVAPLSIWSSPLIDKATSGDDFDLRSLRREKTTVYLHVPAAEVLQAGFLLNLLFSQLINENVKTLPEHDPALKHPCLLLLDEFTAIGKVAILAKAVGFIAGYNLRLLLIIQDKAQLVATYGKEDAQNILSNMGLVISFTPKQLEEAEQLSKMIGDQTVKTRSVQHANVGLLNSGRYSESVTETEQKRAVMLPQELLAMDPGRALLIRQGMPVIFAEKVCYYRDAYFTERLARVPAFMAGEGAQSRRQYQAWHLPAPDWAAYEKQLERSAAHGQSMQSSVGSEQDVQALAESFLSHYLATANDNADTDAR
jgi:type IV secretion system protein VirD4